MPMEWAMVEEEIRDIDAIEKRLQEGYEPFAVDSGHVYFRANVWNEEREPKSSTHQQAVEE